NTTINEGSAGGILTSGTVTLNDGNTNSNDTFNVDLASAPNIFADTTAGSITIHGNSSTVGDVEIQNAAGSAAQPEISVQTANYSSFNNVSLLFPDAGTTLDAGDLLATTLGGLTINGDLDVAAGNINQTSAINLNGQQFTGDTTAGSTTIFNISLPA